MGVETYFFFLIVLGGFGVVWSFRHFSRTKNKISDFEYLAFSSFWGTVMVAVYGWQNQSHPEAMAVLLNPFALGIVMFLAGIFLGGIAGDQWRRTFSR